MVHRRWHRWVQWQRMITVPVGHHNSVGQTWFSVLVGRIDRLLRGLIARRFHGSHDGRWHCWYFEGWGTAVWVDQLDLIGHALLEVRFYPFNFGWYFFGAMIAQGLGWIGQTGNLTPRRTTFAGHLGEQSEWLTISLAIDKCWFLGCSTLWSSSLDSLLLLP